MEASETASRTSGCREAWVLPLFSKASLDDLIRRSFGRLPRERRTASVGGICVSHLMFDNNKSDNRPNYQRTDRRPSTVSR
jgi:hypothetical protein